MRFKSLVYVAVAAIITIVACQKEVSETASTDPGSSTNTGATVTTTVSGRVIDKTGNPIVNALVKSGNATTQTDLNGEFVFANATVSEHAAIVTVEKTGFFKGSRTFIAKASQRQFVEIELLPKDIAGTISATSGGTITTPYGFSLTLPASGVVVKSTGAAYTGSVQVAVAYMDATSVYTPRQMPGDMRAINAAGNEVGLQSYGMVAVELNSASGEALQIASGKKANLQFPINSFQRGSAPATIPLWYFNDSTGMWKEEGVATKNGLYYSADVSHFSFWNCDAQIPIVQFSAKLVDQNGQPLRYKYVQMVRPTGTTGITNGYGYTDSSGNLIGMVPANEALTMKVYASSSCSGTIYTQNIGPFSTATNAGTITITLTAPATYTITGNVVNCSNAPVTFGYVAASTSGRIYRANIVNGSYSLSIPICSGAAPIISYYAVDSANTVQSTPSTITLSAATTSLPLISACGTSASNFINFTFNNNSYGIAASDSTVGFYSQNATYINGFKIGTNNYTGLSFSFGGNAIGAFPLFSLYVSVPNFNDSTFLVPGSINTTITEYGQVGSFIGGSFTGTLRGTGTNTYPIQCTFRVRRDQ